MIATTTPSDTSAILLRLMRSQAVPRRERPVAIFGMMTASVFGAVGRVSVTIFLDARGRGLLELYTKPVGYVYQTKATSDQSPSFRGHLAEKARLLDTNRLSGE